MEYKKININDIDGFFLGNAEDTEAATGCTAIICEDGAVAGVDVRGGGPATRETDLLKSENTVQKINAVVLSGGSAYGLEACSGVMDFLEKRGVGFKAGNAVVPIVCGVSLFDLGVGRSDVRPDKAMGEKAAENAYSNKLRSGNFGAGTGATVGKVHGMGRAMKTGLGTYACSAGKLQVGAVTAVNAFADVYDGFNRMIAGTLSSDRRSIQGSVSALKDMMFPGDLLRDEKNTEGEKTVQEGRLDGRDGEGKLPEPDNSRPNQITRSCGAITPRNDDMIFNTTISCLITNARLTKSQANKLASVLHDGYARAIKPVHSSLDGDTIFVMTTDEVDVNFDSFAALATDIVQYAIIDGAKNAPSAYGFPGAAEFTEE